MPEEVLRSRRRTGILHGLSEVAGQNYYSVKGLREIGEDAISAVWMPHVFAYPYDISLNIDRSKRTLLPWYALKLLGFFVKALRRFDVFHFHFGRSICFNKELPLYHLAGKALFFEFHGSDLRDMERFAQSSKWTFQEEYRMNPAIRHNVEAVCRAADGIIVHDDELIPYLPKDCAPIHVVPLRMDVSAFVPVYPDPSSERVRIVHAPSSRSLKGTKFVLETFERLSRTYNNLELILVEGKNQEEARKLYESADIIVDQLFIGTYGVFSLEGMALGKPVICYISEEMRLCLPEELPIVSADIDSLEAVTRTLIEDGQLRYELGVRGRQYVEDYHDYRKIAHVLRSVYRGELGNMRGREAFKYVKML